MSPIPPARASGDILKNGTAVVTTLILSWAVDVKLALNRVRPATIRKAVNFIVIIYKKSSKIYSFGYKRKELSYFHVSSASPASPTFLPPCRLMNEPEAGICTRRDLAYCHIRRGRPIESPRNGFRLCLLSA